MLIRILSDYFVAGAVVNKGVCIEAAPIIKYMKKWTTLEIVSYCKKKGWRLERYGI